MADSRLPIPVTTITGTSGREAMMREQSSVPLIVDMPRSVRMASKGAVAASPSASFGEVVVVTA